MLVTFRVLGFGGGFCACLVLVYLKFCLFSLCFDFDFDLGFFKRDGSIKTGKIISLL